MVNALLMMAAFAALPFAHLSIWWWLLFSIPTNHCGRCFPFSLSTFVPSFRECKGKNLFYILKIYFFFFLRTPVSPFPLCFRIFFFQCCGLQRYKSFSFF
jgi:hypothetical protein